MVDTYDQQGNAVDNEQLSFGVDADSTTNSEERGIDSTISTPEASEKRRKLGIWLGATVGAVAIAGAGILAAVGSGESESNPEGLNNVSTSSTLDNSNETTGRESSSETVNTDSAESVNEDNSSEAETRFNSYEDIIATTDFVEPEELIIDADIPSSLSEVVAIVDQWSFNRTLSANLGYGIPVLTDPLFYKPYDESWGTMTEDFKHSSDLIGQKRALDFSPEYIQTTITSDVRGFEILSDDIFRIDAKSTISVYGSTDPEDSFAEVGSGWYIRDEITIEGGRVYTTWLRANKQQVVELLGKS